MSRRGRRRVSIDHPPELDQRARWLLHRTQQQAFLFMRRMAEVTNVRFVSREFNGDDAGDAYASDPNAVRRREVPAGVVVYEIDGPFFFGAAEKFRDTLGQIGRNPTVLIIRMRNVPAIDSTAMHALGDIIRRSRKDGTLWCSCPTCTRSR